VLDRPVLSRLILIFFLVILAFAGMESTFALWAIGQFGWGPRQVGYVFSYVGILSAILQGGLIGRLARLCGEERLLVCGLAMIAFGLLVLPFAHHLPALVGAISALALGMGLTQPSLNSLIGPAAAGLLFAEFGRNAPFFWGAALVAAALLVALKLIRGLGAAGLADTKSAEPTR
jgi:MFS family permease